MDSNVVNIIVSILSGLSVCIPLVIELVKYVQKAVKERNWGQIVKLVTDLMMEAEKNFETGAERKKWVMSMIESSASSINYDIDMEEISKLIDSLCDMSKIVNGKTE